MKKQTKMKLTNLEGIEKQLESIWNESARNSPFFIEQTTGTKVGKPGKSKSLVGAKIKSQTTTETGFEAKKSVKPITQKCCLRLSAVSCQIVVRR